MSKYYNEYTDRKIYTWQKGHEMKNVEVMGTQTVEMPMWMINNYIKSTCDNYTKLVYILKIIDIFSNEESDIVDIGISTTSVPINEDGIDFENKLIRYVNYSEDERYSEKYCLMSHLSEKRERDFFHYFSSCDRLVCFAITSQNEVIFLYNPRGNEGIKVRDVSYHSPIDIGWGGLGECIEHLASARSIIRNDRRLQNEHEARMVTQAMQTMREGINVQSMLQDTNLPGSYKEYLQNMYIGLMAKQEKLNEQIGIYCPGVDERI
mgnify:CR=1 FL=1